jgi:REP element-mobilizing transposase RayT
MTDHLHIIIHNPGGNTAVLSDFVGSLKSRTYREYRREFGLNASFWQRYYYDHIIRDHRDFEEKFRYILNNPIKAGLTSRECDPEYVYVNLGIETGRVKPDPYAAK